MASVSDVTVRRVQPTDGAVLRRVRLQALASDPASFGSTYEREAAFPDETWDERAANSAAGDEASTLLAFAGDEPVGLVTAMRDGANRRLFHIVSMWVAPEARRAGTGRRLLREVERWIGSCGGTRAHLSVTNEATAAMRLYESAGYEPDGTTVALEHTPGLVETSMQKELGN
jgi:ribosomal protein S18 acetylase RimI-like enzyme